MSQGTTVEILGELLGTVYRSLPMYLTDARPWTDSADDQAASVVAQVQAEQAELAARIAQAIEQRDGVPDPGTFPFRFVDANLLSLDYLIQWLVQYQAEDVKRIEGLAEALKDDPGAYDLAMEALGASKAHLAMFEELAANQAV